MTVGPCSKRASRVDRLRLGEGGFACSKVYVSDNMVSHFSFYLMESIFEPGCFGHGETGLRMQLIDHPCQFELSEPSQPLVDYLI